MSLELFLVRHAESLGNLDGTHADTDLSPRGQEQARGLSRALSGVQFDCVWSSPLLRAKQTASLALPGTSASIDSRLSELEADTGPTFVDPSNVTALQALLEGPPRRPVESGKAFVERVRAWKADLPRNGRVITFTHTGVVRELLSSFLGFRRAPRQISYTGIFRLEVGAGEPVILAWNECGHCSGLV